MPQDVFASTWHIQIRISSENLCIRKSIASISIKPNFFFYWNIYFLFHSKDYKFGESGKFAQIIIIF